MIIQKPLTALSYLVQMVLKEMVAAGNAAGPHWRFERIDPLSYKIAGRSEIIVAVDDARAYIFICKT